MKHSSGPRKTATLSESIHQRLNSYALAASAAGVSLLSLAQPSEAKIVYTPAHLVFAIIGNYGLDLNHDGITDFTLQNRTYCTWSFCGATLLVSRSGNNRVEGLTRFAYALTAGSPIGPKRPFNGLIMASFLPGGGWVYGYWYNVTDRYLGLKFKIHGKTHYGWARLSVQWVNTRCCFSATLTGYAYETIPDKAIIAGKTKGPDEIDKSVEQPNPNNPGPGAFLTTPIPHIPQPASLGMLALGAQAVPLWQRKGPALEGD